MLNWLSGNWRNSVAEKSTASTINLKNLLKKSTICDLFLDLNIIYNHYKNIKIKKIYGRLYELYIIVHSETLVFWVTGFCFFSSVHELVYK